MLAQPVHLHVALGDTDHLASSVVMTLEVKKHIKFLRFLILPTTHSFEERFGVFLPSFQSSARYGKIEPLGNSGVGRQRKRRHGS